MKNIGIGLFGDFEDAGKNLGKKGTSTDITLYNYKKDDDSVFFVEPTRYPERIHPLIYAINMADYALVFVDEIKPELGETLLALDMLEVKEGAFVVGEYVDVEQLKAIISKTSMKDFEFMEKDYIQIREKMMELPLKEGDTSFVKIPIDYFFTVRSVGTVILGKVEKGDSVKIHDNLRIYPTEKKAMVRSIQVNDKDVKEAGFNSRVGLALKGTNTEELERGMILSNGELNVSDEIELEMKWNPYSNKEIKVGEGYQIICGLQSVSSKVVEKEGDKIKLKLIKPIAYENGEKAVLLDGSAKIRILGVATL
jgi:selenocysteine-specific translation elongation factor